jgi:hypothetical protein
MQVILDVLRDADEEKSGHLDIAQLEGVMKRLGANWGPEELAEVMDSTAGPLLTWFHIVC